MLKGIERRFHKFFEDYGDPTKYKKFTDDELKALPTEFPDFMRDFYIEYGRTLLLDGRFQACHPDDLKGVLSLIFGADKDFNHKSYHAFAYSAFGDIYFWNSEKGMGIIYLLNGRVTCNGVVTPPSQADNLQNQFIVPFCLSPENFDHPDLQGKPLFKRAVKKCGPLDIGECYGFVPALALGGIEDIECVTRQKSAAAHFAFVAQTVNFNLIDVQGYEKSVIVRPIG